MTTTTPNTIAIQATAIKKRRPRAAAAQPIETLLSEARKAYTTNVDELAAFYAERLRRDCAFDVEMAGTKIGWDTSETLEPRLWQFSWDLEQEAPILKSVAWRHVVVAISPHNKDKFFRDQEFDAHEEGGRWLLSRDVLDAAVRLGLVDAAAANAAVRRANQ